MSIGDRAFAYFTVLTSVSLPASVTEIGSSAFAGCTSLSSVYLPPSVTTIGSCAFADCKRLSSVSLPAYTHISNDAIRSFLLHPQPTLFLPFFSIRYIASDIFQNCASLSTILTSQTPNDNANNTLPHSATVIAIDKLIPSLQDAPLAQRDIALSLINLDASSFNQPTTLYLSNDGLQQLVNSPQKDVLNQLLPHITQESIKKATHSAFPSLSLQKLKNQFSLDDATYKIMLKAILEPCIHQIDVSLYFLLPIVENLSLRDLKNFAQLSQQPLQAQLDSEKHTSQPQPHNSPASTSAVPTTRLNPSMAHPSATLRLNLLSLACALILSICTLGMYPLVCYFLLPKNRFSWHLPRFMYTKKPPSLHTTRSYSQAMNSNGIYPSRRSHVDRSLHATATSHPPSIGKGKSFSTATNLSP